jgi:hypothetical protein
MSAGRLILKVLEFTDPVHQIVLASCRDNQVAVARSLLDPYLSLLSPVVSHIVLAGRLFEINRSRQLLVKAYRAREFRQRVLLGLGVKFIAHTVWLLDANIVLIIVHEFVGVRNFKAIFHLAHVKSVRLGLVLNAFHLGLGRVEC